MLFFPPTSNQIGRHQAPMNQHPCPRPIIKKLTLLLISHWNARCKSMFGSFMIKQIRISDAQRGYSVFPARLSSAISETCPKVKHRWSKSDARWPNNELRNLLHEVSSFGIREIFRCINTSGLAINVAIISLFIPAFGDLERMLTTVESQGDYTEEQKNAPAGAAFLLRFREFLGSKNDRPPHQSRYERRLFPPEQSSKTSRLLNELRANRNKFRSGLAVATPNLTMRGTAIV